MTPMKELLHLPQLPELSSLPIWVLIQPREFQFPSLAQMGIYPQSQHAVQQDRLVTLPPAAQAPPIALVGHHQLKKVLRGLQLQVLVRLKKAQHPYPP
jgi:hypothetical protein